jgi:ubiquinone/menaquinone biosynthesis C-methylase UbiE
LYKGEKMTHPRIPETDHGIQGVVTVTHYDEMQRHLRDKGWIETQSILKSGIHQGHALEVGHGPGYLGLEWLKYTRNTRLTGLDISPDMTALATQNAREYGFEDRTQYKSGRGDQLPFEDDNFDAVFTNGSLHEWTNPEGTFDELFRVLKPGGRYFISDLRRDMSIFMRWFLSRGTKPVSIRPYLFTSIDAAYTPAELKEMVAKTHLRDASVTGNLIRLTISGQKPSVM